MSLSDKETPCFTGRPDAEMYTDAILFVLNDRRADEFDIGVYLNGLLHPAPTRYLEYDRRAICPHAVSTKHMRRRHAGDGESDLYRSG